MKKFFVLLKKEIRELLTPQMLIPMIITALLFVVIGNVIGKEQRKSQQPQTLAILDQDESETSKAMINSLPPQLFKIDLRTKESIEQAIKDAKDKKYTLLLVIPAGLEKGLKEFKPQEIKTYSILRNFSLTDISKATILNTAISSINEFISNQLLAKKIGSLNPLELKNPIRSNEFVIIGDREANISSQQVMTFMSSQTTFIPIILFLVIILAAQLIALAVATEKENKTLETLLSTPVNRKYIVAAKLIGAAIVSLLMVAIYIIGLNYFKSGITGGALQLPSTETANAALQKLDLFFSPLDYLFLGTTIFFSIIAALSIAIILGAFAQDSKSVQGVITPLMILIMIPYFLVLFIDINSVSPLIKYLIYAIPFSHAFLAAPNIMLRNYDAVFFGIVYQFAFFLVFVYIAAKIFSSDRIVTMKISFRKKKNNI